MKVRELIAELQQFDPELDVWYLGAHRSEQIGGVGMTPFDDHGEPWNPGDLTRDECFYDLGIEDDDPEADSIFEAWLDSLTERLTIW